MDINASKISSLSSCGKHSIAITTDGEALGIGDNLDSCFSKKSQKTVLSKFTKIDLRGIDGKKCKAVSAVCGGKYTLFLIKSKKSDKMHLYYLSSLTEYDFPGILNTVRSPMSLFGGYFNCAAIDGQGSIIFISESIGKWPDKYLESTEIPFNYKAINVACCKEKVYVLVSNGKVFSSSIDKSGKLSFSSVEELNEIVQISGTYEHCLAVDINGNVFGCGKNCFGCIGIGKVDSFLNKFTLITTLSKYKITSAFAGNNHSLFLTSQGKVLACGSNLSGQLFLESHQTQPTDVFPIYETTIGSGATFCIAGYDNSFVFVGCDAPNSPNRSIAKITIKSHSIIQQLNPKNDFVSSQKKEIDDLLNEKDKEIAKLMKESEEQKNEIEILRKECLEKDKEIMKLNKDKEIQSIEIKRLRSEVSFYKKSKNAIVGSSESNEIKYLNVNDINKLERFSELGSGGGGRVFKVGEAQFALKELLNVGHERMRRFINEYEIMSILEHPNILRANGIFIGDSTHFPCILLELCMTNLEAEVQKGSLSKAETIFALFQIAEGMNYVHFRNVIHRDLKPSNILITKDGTIKIGDFGISKLISVSQQSSMTGGIGTQKFMAPEIINEDEYNEKVDVYSFGVLMLFVLNGGDLSAIKIGDILCRKKLKLPYTLSNFAAHLIGLCMSFDPNSRPSFKVIRNQIIQNKEKIIELSSNELNEVSRLIKAHKSKIQSYE